MFAHPACMLQAHHRARQDNARLTMSLSTTDLQDRIAKLDALNAHLTFRISRMSKLLEIEGALRLADSGINLTAYRMMLVIHVFEEISVSDLSKIMLIDRAQISRAATELIDAGLLEARADRISKRKKLLALTDSGVALYERLRARFDEREAALTDEIGEDIDALWRTVNRISDWLEVQTGAGR